MDWPTLCQLFGNAPLPPASADEAFETVGALTSISSLFELVHEECALEGLDGATFSTLLNRLRHREDFAGDSFSSSTKSRVAECLKLSPHITFHQPVNAANRSDLAEECFDERILEERMSRYSKLLTAENDVIDRQVLLSPETVHAVSTEPASSTALNTADAANADAASILQSSFSVTTTSAAYPPPLETFPDFEQRAAVSLHAAYPYYPLHRNISTKQKHQKIPPPPLGSCLEYYSRENVSQQIRDQKLLLTEADNPLTDNNNKLLIVASVSLRCTALTQCNKWLDFCFTPDGYVMLEYIARCRSKATYTTSQCLFNWDPKVRAQDVHYFLDCLLFCSPVITKQIQLNAIRSTQPSSSSSSSQLLTDAESMLPSPTETTTTSQTAKVALMSPSTAYTHRITSLRHYSPTGNGRDQFELQLVMKLKTALGQFLPRVMLVKYVGSEKICKHLLPRLPFVHAVTIDFDIVVQNYPTIVRDGLVKPNHCKKIVCYKYSQEEADRSRMDASLLSWIMPASMLTARVAQPPVVASRHGKQSNNNVTAAALNVGDVYAVACAALQPGPQVFCTRSNPYDFLHRRARAEFSRAFAATGAKLQPSVLSALCEQSTSCARQIFRGVIKEINLQARRQKSTTKRKQPDDEVDASCVIDVEVDAAAAKGDVDAVDSMSISAPPLALDADTIACIAAECAVEIRETPPGRFASMQRDDWIALVSKRLPLGVRTDWQAAYAVSCAVLERVMQTHHALGFVYMAFSLPTIAENVDSNAADDDTAVAAGATEIFSYAVVPPPGATNDGDEAGDRILQCKLQLLGCEQRLKQLVYQQHVAADTSTLVSSTEEILKKQESTFSPENVNYPRAFQFRALHHFLLKMTKIMQLQQQEQSSATPALTESHKQLHYLSYPELFHAMPTGLLLRLAARSLRAEFFAGRNERHSTSGWIPTSCRQMLAHQNLQRVPFWQLPVLLRQTMHALFDKALKKGLLELSLAGIVRFVHDNSKTNSSNSTPPVVMYKTGTAPLNDHISVVLHTRYYFIDTTCLYRVRGGDAASATEIIAAALAMDPAVLCCRELVSLKQIDDLWVDLLELSRITDQQFLVGNGVVERRAVLAQLSQHLKRKAESDLLWPNGIVGYPQASSTTVGACGMETYLHLQSHRFVEPYAYTGYQLGLPSGASSGVFVAETTKIPIARVDEWDKPFARSRKYLTLEAKLKQQQRSDPSAVRTGPYVKLDAKWRESLQKCIKNHKAASNDADKKRRSFDDSEKPKKKRKAESTVASEKKKQPHGAKFYMTKVCTSPESSTPPPISSENSSSSLLRSALANVMREFFTLKMQDSLLVPWLQQQKSNGQMLLSMTLEEQVVLCCALVAQELMAECSDESRAAYADQRPQQRQQQRHCGALRYHVRKQTFDVDFVCRSALLPTCFARMPFRTLRRLWNCLVTSKGQALAAECRRLVRLHITTTIKTLSLKDAMGRLFGHELEAPTAISREQLNVQLHYAHGVGTCALMLMEHMKPPIHDGENDESDETMTMTQCFTRGAYPLMPYVGITTLDNVRNAMLVCYTTAYATVDSTWATTTTTSKSGGGGGGDRRDWQVPAARALAAMRFPPTFAAAGGFAGQNQFSSHSFRRTLNVMKKLYMLSYGQKIKGKYEGRFRTSRKKKLKANPAADDDDNQSTMMTNESVDGYSYMPTASFTVMFEPGAASRRVSAALACTNVSDNLSEQIVRSDDAAQANMLKKLQQAFVLSITSCCNGNSELLRYLPLPDAPIDAECFVLRNGAAKRPCDLNMSELYRSQRVTANSDQTASAGNNRTRGTPKRRSAEAAEAAAENAAESHAGAIIRSLPISNVLEVCIVDEAKQIAVREALISAFENVCSTEDKVFQLDWCARLSASEIVPRQIVENYLRSKLSTVADSNLKIIIDAVMSLLNDIMLTGWRGASFTSIICGNRRRSEAVCRKALRILLDCHIVIRTGSGSSGASVSYVAFPHAQHYLLTAFAERTSLDDAVAGCVPSDCESLTRLHYYEPRPWKSVAIQQHNDVGAAAGQCRRAALVRYFRAVILAIDQARLTCASFSSISMRLMPSIQPFHVRVLLEHLSQVGMVALSLAASSSALVQNEFYADQPDFLVELAPDAVASLLMLEQKFGVQYTLNPNHHESCDTQQTLDEQEL